MKLALVLTTVVVVWLSLTRETRAVPLTLLSSELTNSLEEEDDDSPIGEDDMTTHGLERLSSAATCLVAGVEYTHGQQIYRVDPCEFCLCLDGEMFCWWQDCPPTMEGPCRDRGPFSPCMSIPVAPPIKPQHEVAHSSSTTLSATKTTTLQNSGVSNIQTTSEMSSEVNELPSTTDFLTDTSVSTGVESFNASVAEDKVISTTEEPVTCIVMGREYQIGDKLPHDTGNCLECICGQGAKVSCSPNQCAPAGDEMNDYRPPGPRHPIPDVF
ncbi:cysteine-rich motor neuron 1 protein [Cylas formicarius]|uniref:cysteine-rich motor neuron 1 protein n=1 Tax=Cylas formicarius TaxID=197179 RepID=UPI0029588820|nr:cysteine-rich motor neuron 1 protein [Cylas formicarius]